MLNFKHCEFFLGVAELDQFPAGDRPEAAFAGRSNVGKSSLLNALSGRKNLARISKTPGRTQQLNFFDLDGRLYLVDLPGYGYAKVPKTQKRGWNRLIRDYLGGRPNLRCTFVLIDARRGLKEVDREIMKMLDEAGAAYRIVLTKTDKVKGAALEKVIESTEKNLKSHPAAFPQALVTSAHKGEGIENLRRIIASFDL